jgi:hypothetical protein
MPNLAFAPHGCRLRARVDVLHHCMRLHLGSRTDPPTPWSTPWSMPSGLCLIPLRCPDRTPNTASCPETVVPPGRAATRANLSPWRPTLSCMASGHAPAAQNCPRSRTTTRLTRHDSDAFRVCCQRRSSVGSGGAGNTKWRTQVFRTCGQGEPPHRP